MREQNIQQLNANVEWTKKQVFQVHRLDQQMISINNKPIKVGCFTFILMSIGTIAFHEWMYPIFIKNKINAPAGMFITFFPILALSILIFIANRFLIQMKKGIHEKAIKVYPSNRRKLMQALATDSIIPSTYWNSVYLDRINSYFINKRADTLKEALNLLELDIKHDEQMQQLQSIQDSIPTVFVGVSTEI